MTLVAHVVNVAHEGFGTGDPTPMGRPGISAGGRVVGIRVRRCAVRRGMAVAMLAVVALVEQPAVAGAVPPPPPPPSDDEVEAGRDRAADMAAQVGRLANQVAEADAALVELQSEVALTREDTNEALVHLQAARAVATAARVAADDARAEADAATVQITEAQRQIDQFAAASFRQDSTIGSVTAFLGTNSPQDLLARAELLDAVAGSQLDVLEQMRLARTRSANKHAQAGQALTAAHRAEQAATDAKNGADAAYRAAITAEASQTGRASALRTREFDLEQQLSQAQRVVAGFAGARQRYAQWVTQRDSDPAGPAVEQASAEPGAAEADTGGAAQTVIGRAMAQRDVPYSWGGGDADGATVGIRDGGVADAHGDYRTAGFDCSGLMIYAFAPVLGYSLPHYSGAQYRAGRHVPLAQKRPGDMLFWATRGRIHHVALYIGNEQMIEAPYSGSAVRVTSVRLAGIMPHATRVL
ncbi:MAG: NlpC/P60 family protein [Pseudonocardiaceae bacterium]